ncbi:MAG: hypothetical protein A3J93_00650 [Candidatus Magasanikbacteria bacterium RIFOXYC2_FULL_42_28]|uniref:PD-(D/E)XK endonuclease-like domain-containing protein n=1 Tax=Candidatus Magasanikbacteria bacterium RIFOXYC2_FULL_42_28 TaxID=1798704 RepID=A0A1F6NXD3_9BACT|nr:MAG: hypothetical protein A3J93_00650 [Candidatus Magasanikbacteria bacterium RIFOXYC2_FULL_42_28]
MPDKFSAVWVSHSSSSDFLKCPQLYYYQNVYKDPKTNHKIKVMAPALALGSAVHEVLESISVLPTDKRFDLSLLDKFHDLWPKFSGKRGGFWDETTENKYRARGEEMLRRAYNHPGILKKPAVKIKEDLPYYWLSEEEGIILCGKIDWLEYLPETDSVHIVDFKTGKSEEDEASLQLPIYNLLVTNCQKRQVTKASYWYLETNDELTEKPLPDLAESKKRVLDVAMQMKLARQLNRFKCPEGESCRYCKPLLAVLSGQGEGIGLDEYGRTDLYILPPKGQDRESVIL